MTVRRFFELKNELVFDAVGITLVPEDQIVDMDPVPLVGGDSDADICPYCVLYLEEEFGRRSCEECPMETAGNRCGNNSGSTYTDVAMRNEEIDGIINIPGVRELVNQYNKENGFNKPTISGLNKEELLYFIEEYNNYVVDFPDYHDNRSYPVCIYEFFGIEFQEILADEEKNKEESK